MELRTKFFGTIDYAEKDCLRFPVGLFGFEEEQSFLLLPFAGSEGSMLCLQSVSTPALAFIVMDPFALRPDYTPRPQPAELRFLGVKSSEELCYYVLCRSKKPISESTVNLKCPIVIHPATLLARQVILETDEYGMAHPLSEFGGKGDAPPC